MIEKQGSFVPEKDLALLAVLYTWQSNFVSFVNTLVSPVVKKSLLLLILFIFILDSFSQENNADRRTGVEICYTISDDMFPRHWSSRRIRAEAVPLDQSEIPRIERLLQKVMEKYPAPVLSRHLEKIYLLKSLSFYGLSFGGTFSVARKSIYLTDDPVLQSSDDFIENLFHHEFSSILFRNYKRYLNPGSWKEVNPPGFRYGNGGVEAIRCGNSSMDYDTALNKNGFLNLYAQSSAEEDFEVFSQNLFNGGPAFWRSVDKYEKIRIKARMVIDFFHRIDPVFTEEYFRRM